MSQYTILQAKMNVINKKLNEHITYVEKHCIYNKSMDKNGSKSENYTKWLSDYKETQLTTKNK
tara:strand:- start:984 stop:1172 length:189 start_codon:yes stop_codon:yes gene_type:complete